MNMGQEGVENPLEALEENVEAFQEKKERLDERQEQIDQTLAGLEQDAALQQALEHNRENLTVEQAELENERMDAVSSLEQIREQLEQIDAETNNSDAALDVLRMLGEDVTESDAILADRRAWLEECYRRVEDLAAVLGENYEALGRFRPASEKPPEAVQEAPEQPEEHAAQLPRNNEDAVPDEPPVFASTTGLSSAFAKGAGAALSRCAYPEVRALYAKYQNEIRCMDRQETLGAYFAPADGGIYFNEAIDANGSDYQEPYEIAFHEFGHNIDWLLGGKDNHVFASNRFYNGQDLENLILSDYAMFKAMMGVGRDSDLIDLLKAENMSMRECGNISDILEFCTGCSYPLGIGHGASYHKEKGMTAKEFFAEVLDSAAANEASLRQMRRIFPHAVDFVFDIIKGEV